MLYSNSFLSIYVNRIRADHNDDNSIEIINLWLSRVTKEYHEVNYKNDVDNEDYANVSVAFEATNKTIWTSERFNHVIKLKEEALNYARAVWADYIFVSRKNLILSSFHISECLITKNILLNLVCFDRKFYGYNKTSTDLTYVFKSLQVPIHTVLKYFSLDSFSSSKML